MRAFDIRPLGDVLFESDASERADVAVVIPLYDYAPFIIDCLSSVVDQTLDRLSVVVVDDCSTDDGPRLAENFLRQHASRFCSSKLVGHKKNQGPSMARNTGIAWTAEPLLFMLDADNRIRPPALARLKSALNIDGADFTYSQLFMFGLEAGVGNADIWHIDRLRYGNKIDAMAMILAFRVDQGRGLSGCRGRPRSGRLRSLVSVLYVGIARSSMFQNCFASTDVTGNLGRILLLTKISTL